MKGHQCFTLFVVDHEIETHISIQFFTICRFKQQQMRATSQIDSRDIINAKNWLQSNVAEKSVTPLQIRNMNLLVANCHSWMAIMILVARCQN